MSQQSYMQNNIEQQKKVLKDYQVKLEKHGNRINKIAIAIIILHLICLFAIPFASVKGETISMIEMFQSSDTDVNSAKFGYVMVWISTVTLAGITIKAFRNREKKHSWIKPHFVGSIINLVCLTTMLAAHAISEIDALSGYSESCYIWWLIPIVAEFVHFIITVFGFIYAKYIPVLENNVAEWEKQD